MKLATAFRQRNLVTVSQYSGYLGGHTTYAFPKEEFCLPAFVAVKNRQGTYDVMKVVLQKVKQVAGTDGEQLLEALKEIDKTAHVAA